MISNGFCQGCHKCVPYWNEPNFGHSDGCPGIKVTEDQEREHSLKILNCWNALSLIAIECGGTGTIFENDPHSVIDMVKKAIHELPAPDAMDPSHLRFAAEIVDVHLKSTNFMNSYTLRSVADREEDRRNIESARVRRVEAASKALWDAGYADPDVIATVLEEARLLKELND